MFLKRIFFSFSNLAFALRSSHVFSLPIKRLVNNPVPTERLEDIQGCGKKYELHTNSLSPPWITSPWTRQLRSENRSPNSPPRRETGMEMPCCPPIDLLWVQITQSYPNRLRFSNLPCPQSPCHTVTDPVFKEGFLPISQDLDESLSSLSRLE
jgi:hypothetical protein